MVRKNECKAKDPKNCRYHKITTTSISGRVPVTMKHGVEVVEGKIAVSGFAKTFNKREGLNSYFEGSWETLVKLVAQNWKNQEPGTGSINGDVILVNVPAEGFKTSITEITDENKHLVEKREHVRQDGEKPVSMKVLKGVKPPAKYVQVVVYRADTLAQDNDRSSDAEWEIIAVNAQLDLDTPMHPTTMLRNENHEDGGTLRSYSDSEWSASETYWETHAYIEE